MRTLISPSAYVRTEVMAIELEELFAGSWQLGGFARDLQKDGDYVTAAAAGRNVVIQRFGTALKAFTNVCSHRHSLIRTDPKGNGPLRCGYHGWQYDENGIPAVIPHKPRFDNMTPTRRAELCLEGWEVEACGEFIFIRLRSTGSRLADDLGPAYEIIRQIGESLGDLLYMGSDLIEANWKIVVENSLEAYHVEFLHADTFAALGLRQTDINTTSRNTIWSAAWNDKHTTRMEGLNRSLYASRPFACEGYKHVLLFPNIMVATSFGTSFAVHTVTPVAPDRSEYRSFFFSTKLQAELPPVKVSMKKLVEQELVRFNRKVFGEDLKTLGEVQRGVQHARKGGELSDEEARIASFHGEYMRILGVRSGS